MTALVRLGLVLAALFVVAVAWQVWREARAGQLFGPADDVHDVFEED